ncbi:MAG: hypothetical protein MJ014_02350 [Methanocorpusculum sp.]|nr:hypothetical protein [Methanocorpusculum sp.]
MQFPSTSAYLTAIILVTLYGWAGKYHAPPEDLEPVTAAWIAWHKSRVTAEDRLRQTFFDILSYRVKSKPQWYNEQVLPLRLIA